ncbi:hypothetical protein C8R44DRAFT_746137 [Mycena epipterygia]|nr:hypothetical protein C8R44DRAFT_746137 [Mycena epipterygia]
MSHVGFLGSSHFRAIHRPPSNVFFPIWYSGWLYFAFILSRTIPSPSGTQLSSLKELLRPQPQVTLSTYLARRKQLAKIVGAVLYYFDQVFSPCHASPKTEQMNNNNFFKNIHPRSLPMSDDTAFKKSDWIGLGKPMASAPPMIRRAARDTFTIPQSLHYVLLPGPMLSIAEMLKFNLPVQFPPSSTGAAKPQYFSMAAPDALNENAVIRLRGLPIPEAKVVHRLVESSRQASLWFSAVASARESGLGVMTRRFGKDIDFLINFVFIFRVSPSPVPQVFNSEGRVTCHLKTWSK